MTDNIIAITQAQIDAGEYPPPPPGFAYHLCDQTDRPLLYFIPTEEPATVEMSCGHIKRGLEGEWEHG